MESRRTRSPLSNFISIRMKKQQPKIGIKLPKLLANTMQKSVAHHHGDHKNNKKCARKVTLVFTNPFAKYMSSSKSNETNTNGSRLRPPRVRLPLLGFLTKKTSLKKLMRSKTAAGADGIKKTVSSGRRLVRVVQKPMLSNCTKLRTAMSFMRARMMKSKEKMEEDSKQDSSSDYELCKKRILMGGKCRSGSLHYDQNGVLLNDVLP